MAMDFYLAMTAAEFSVCPHFPEKIGWLACHFSPSGPGLSNIPKALPPGAVLLLDDSTPFQNHRIQYILQQLQEIIDALQIRAVILDLQRPNVPGVHALTELLQKELPCPVAAPPGYTPAHAPVFLPPCPLYRPLKKHLQPYLGREIWLDAAPLPVQLVLTSKGCGAGGPSAGALARTPHREQALHCHYGITLENDRAIFTFTRNSQELQDWFREAEQLGVHAVIGLYQEFRT